MHPKRRKLEGNLFKRLLIFKANKDFYWKLWNHLWFSLWRLHCALSPEIIYWLVSQTKNVMFWRSLPQLHSSAPFVDAFGKIIICGKLVRKIQWLVNQNGIFLINATNMLHRSRVATTMGHEGIFPWLRSMNDQMLSFWHYCNMWVQGIEKCATYKG